MKGIVYAKPGTPAVLRLIEMKKPVPKARQVLVRVKASSLNTSDCVQFLKPIETGKTLSFSQTATGGVSRTARKALGGEMSGIVEETGKNVTAVKPGDEVFGIAAGLSGAWAEYVLANEKEIAVKPANLNFEEAAAVPIAGISALSAVRTARIQPGQNVLVYGASGGVGQFAVQLAKAAGAVVTAVCSTRNVEIARAIGADYIIDYRKEDFSQNGTIYDAILAINGYNPIGKYKKSLKKGGVYVAIGGARQGVEGLLFGPFASIGSGKKCTFGTYFFEINHQPLSYLKEVIEEGKVKPFIEKTCSPQELPEVITGFVQNHARGKVAVKMELG